MKFTKNFKDALAILKYINSNQQEQITLKNMAKKLFIDEYSMCRVVKKLRQNNFLKFGKVGKKREKEIILLIKDKCIFDLFVCCGKRIKTKSAEINKIESIVCDTFKTINLQDFLNGGNHDNQI